ncbi:hypothetical protein SAMN05421759_102238 [Roseivivax lentus]|uniref:DUF2975 domain-containing protein n=1 Tax=Roseivivax lentus TaxID=633194 RepID=A0A1N7L0A7_9RHOB|nr:hypothetical protein [Roseivivax lentus]SIS67196.1 hypothetical protein SAMN05421759_102238 [Roseivivax lentus]
MIDARDTLSAARRLERVMLAATFLLVALALIGLAAGIANPLDMARGIAWQGGYDGVALTHGQAWLLIAHVAIHVGVWIALLIVARGLFGQLAAGNPAAAARSARRVARLLWAMLAWGLVSQPIASATATWGLPEGERTLSVAFGTPQISVAFAALMASFMAHAFALGAELWQDHREVI